MNKPLVSVIVATYRREDTLKYALMSLAEQTYENFEVILVDDNGNSEWNIKVKEIVESIPELNLRLIVNNPNKGSAKARNEGIFAANGEYITFLDDDDIYLPDKISNQVDCIVESDTDMCLTDLYLYNENDLIVDKRIRNYIKATDRKSLLTYHLMYHMTGTDTLMFRTSFLREIEGFPPIDVGDEFYLVLKAIENNCKLVYLPKCDVKAYVHAQNGGISTRENKINGENALFKRKKEYFNQIDKSTVRFIKMRHYAVLAIANKNCGRIGAVIYNLLKSFISTPVGFVKLLASHKF